MSEDSRRTTQALIAELAESDRRILEQLRELSGISQSPISPRQAYASVQATPRSGQPYSPLRVAAEARTAGDEGEACEARVTARSRGTIGNLVHDLARLQHLLRHSPLHDGERQYDVENEECGDQLDLFTPTVQRYTKQREREEEKAALILGTGEKRTRVSPVAPVSHSPAAPEVKRDRRETQSYAPPPPLRRFCNASSDGGAVLDGDAPQRRSEVLDFADEGDGGVGDGKAQTWRRSDVVRSPRVGATMFATRGGDFREAHVVRSYSEARVTGAAVPLSHGDADVAGQWSRSPVRWIAASTNGATRQMPVEHENGKEAREGMPCTSAIEAWKAHHSPVHHHVEETYAKRATGDISAATVSTPPPMHFFLNEASQLQMAPPESFTMASPPPRIPVPPPPVPRATPTAAGFPTPAAGPMDFSPVVTVGEQRAVCTPQPATKTYGMPRKHTEQVPATTSRSRRAASALPRGVTHTTSWQGLRAFFTRQSRVPAFLTPEVGGAEDGPAATMQGQ